MPDLRKYLVLANLTERMFVWTPPKTGSTTAVGILSKLGFLPYSISGKYLIPTSEEPHNHNCTFYEGHEKYSFITSKDILDISEKIYQKMYFESNSISSYLDSVLTELLDFMHIKFSFISLEESEEIMRELFLYLRG